MHVKIPHFRVNCPTMWKLLYQLASPKLYYLMTGRLSPWLGYSALFFMLSGMIWGLIFAPPDYQQGDAYRIIFIHVPCAFLSLALYAWLGFLALLLLVWRIKIAGMLLIHVARIGACMAFLALATGSIWGKPMWGSWWVWDARLTSELILLLLYLAVLATFHSIRNKSAAEKMIAVLILVGLVDLPIIHYSVYWWNSLHQGATLSALSKPKIAASMLYPLLCSIIGFFLFCIWVVVQRSRHDLVLREKEQSWVRMIFEKGEIK